MTLQKSFTFPIIIWNVKEFFEIVSLNFFVGMSFGQNIFNAPKLNYIILHMRLKRITSRYTGKIRHSSQ